MRTCKIEINYTNAGNEIYNAYFDSTITHPTGAKITTRLDEILTMDEKEVVNFLWSKGVDISEAEFALLEMKDKGHNKAEFGMLGSFIFSQYVGKVH